MVVLTPTTRPTRRAPQVVYLQLQPNNSYSHVTWRRMFRVLLEICKLYAGIEADTRVSVDPNPYRKPDPKTLNQTRAFTNSGLACLIR